MTEAGRPGGAMIKEHWSPETLADLNDHELTVVKVRGEFTATPRRT